MIGLTYILKLEDMTTAALAQKIGIAAPTITQWEKKKRPIPKDRLEQLYELFPIYPQDYFSKDIDEKDALKLQNCLLTHRLEDLQNKSDLDSIRLRNAIKKKRERNDNLIQQQRIIMQAKTIFDRSFELTQIDDIHILINRHIIENFARFCSLEDKIVTAAAKTSRANTEVTQELKSLIEALKEQMMDLEYISEISKSK